MNESLSTDFCLRHHTGPGVSSQPYLTMPAIETILIGLLMTAGAAGSAWTWWQTTCRQVPYWQQPRRDPPPHTPWLFVAGGALLIVKVLLIQTLGAPLLASFAGPPPEDPAVFDSARVNLMTQINAGVSVVVILVAAGILVARSTEDRRALGFRRDQLRQQAWFGVQGFFLAFLPVFLLVLAVSPWKQSPDAIHPLLRLITDGYLLWPLVAAILIAPIQEELVYRVLLQEGLIAAGYPIRIVLPAVAAFFCLNHLNLAHPSPDLIPLFPLALLFGATYHYRNSFQAAVLMHMLFNTFNLVLALLGGTMT